MINRYIVYIYVKKGQVTPETERIMGEGGAGTFFVSLHLPKGIYIGK